MWSFSPELAASFGGCECGGPGGCSVGLLHSTEQVLKSRGHVRRKVRHGWAPVDNEIKHYLTDFDCFRGHQDDLSKRSVGFVVLLIYYANRFYI